MLALAMAVSLLDPFPLQGMDGLWRSEDNDAIYLIHIDKEGGGGFGGAGSAKSVPRVEYLSDDMYGRADNFTLPPDGIPLGEWGQWSRLATAMEKAGGPAKSSGDSGWSGYLKVAPGPAASTGSPAYYLFERYDSRGNSFKSQRAYYLGAESRVRFAAKYGDDSSEINFSFGTSETGGATWPITGSISYLGKAADIKGTLARMRATFTIIEHDTGRIVGQGYFAWNPTSSQISAFADDTWGPTKRLALDITWSGATSSSGDRRMLTAK